MKYEGGTKRDEMEGWLKQFVDSANRLGGGVRELTHLMHASGSCNRADSTPCILWFLNPTDSTDLLADVASDFGADPIKFYWVDKTKYPGFVDKFEGNDLVIFRGKRKRFAPFEGELTATNLHNWVSGAVSGGGGYEALDDHP
jgi:hypothetical protein